MFDFHQPTDPKDILWVFDVCARAFVNISLCSLLHLVCVCMFMLFFLLSYRINTHKISIAMKTEVLAYTLREKQVAHFSHQSSMKMWKIKQNQWKTAQKINARSILSKFLFRWMRGQSTHTERESERVEKCLRKFKVREKNSQNIELLKIIAHHPVFIWN